MGFLLRPIAAGMCRYESIKDGSLDLVDFKIMNNYLDVQAHNEQVAYDIANNK